jgi:predicted nucleic acid-binding Zn ribbon protein
MFCRSLFVPLYVFFWPLCCLFVFDKRILITPVVSFGHCVVCSSSIYGFWLPLWYLLAIVLSVLLRQTDSDYPCGIFWPLCCLFFFDIRILITPVVSFGHCVVCSSSIYGFWLPLWYLQTLLTILRRFLYIYVKKYWSNRHYCCKNNIEQSLRSKHREGWLRVYVK